MKKTLLAIVLLAVGISTASAEWKIAGDKIRTTWAEQVTPENVHQQYPRPQLQRAEWMNLNGLWNYAITDLAAPQPTAFDGQILVPFAVESALSGVQKRVTKENILWYERTFTAPEERELIRHIAAYTDSIISSAKDYNPAIITRYVIDLATLFHKFYNACPVKSAEDALKYARLELCVATASVIRNALSVLKIDAPEKM